VLRHGAQKWTCGLMAPSRLALHMLEPVGCEASITRLATDSTDHSVAHMAWVQHKQAPRRLGASTAWDSRTGQRAETRCTEVDTWAEPQRCGWRSSSGSMARPNDLTCKATAIASTTASAPVLSSQPAPGMAAAAADAPSSLCSKPSCCSARSLLPAAAMRSARSCRARKLVTG
jgi:hypothetical protein